MDALVVAGLIIAFVLLMLPAVVIPLLNQDPSRVDVAGRPGPGAGPHPAGPVPEPVTGGYQSDRLAA